MKTLVLQSELRKQLGTLGVAARPWLEGPAVTLTVLLVLIIAITLVAAVEAIVLAVLVLAVAIAMATLFFFAVGLAFLIVHPLGDLFLILYLLWLLYPPKQDPVSVFPNPLPELS